MKVVITESQYNLIMETSLFIKRRFNAITEALSHAMSTGSVIQPDEYGELRDYMRDVFTAVVEELSWDTSNGYFSDEEEQEIINYLSDNHWDDIQHHWELHNDVEEEDDEY